MVILEEAGSFFLCLPNFFFLLLFQVTTDDLEAAYKKIVQELRTIYNETDTQEELNFNKSCSAYKEIVTRRTKKMMEYLLIQNK